MKLLHQTAVIISLLAVSAPAFSQIPRSETSFQPQRGSDNFPGPAFDPMGLQRGDKVVVIRTVKAPLWTSLPNGHKSRILRRGQKLTFRTFTKNVGMWGYLPNGRGQVFVYLAYIAPVHRRVH